MSERTLADQCLLQSYIGISVGIELAEEREVRLSSRAATRNIPAKSCWLGVQGA